MIARISEEHLLLIRYGITGVLGALLQVCTLWLWVDVGGLHAYYLWGVVIGFCAALAITFPLQKYWSFRDKAHHRVPRQFVWYTLIALASLFLNTLSLLIAKTILESLHVNFFHMWYLIAETIIVIIIAGLSFLTNRSFTFKSAVPDDRID